MKDKWQEALSSIQSAAKAEREKVQKIDEKNDMFEAIRKIPKIEGESINSEFGMKICYEQDGEVHTDELCIPLTAPLHSNDGDFDSILPDELDMELWDLLQ